MPTPPLTTELQKAIHQATTGQYGAVILAPDGSVLAGSVVQATDSRLKRPERYTYADVTERNAATGFVADDVGKWALQLDKATYWRLSNHLPITWQGPYGPNSPDEFLLDRANHTGTQPWGTITATPTTIVGYGITDAAETIDDRVAALVVPGANITTTYDDVANTLTIAATIPSETIDDRVAALLQAGTNVTLTYDDVANTLTIASTVSNEAIDDRVAALLVAGTNISLAYDDVANTLCLSSEM